MKSKSHVNPDPIYSICMVNYNMAATLRASIFSLIFQLDERFELVIVDDGSTDGSQSVIKELCSEFPSISGHFLIRDLNRKVGFTRNFSIAKARGKYVLLHLDCDDIFGAVLKDFVVLYHQIESAKKGHFLLVGDHVNMGPKDFLLSHGPYVNIFRGEDRNLWVRLAFRSEILFLKHKVFISRLPKPFLERLYRAIFYTKDQIENDFKTGNSLRQFLYFEFRRKRFFPRYLVVYRSVLAIFYSFYYRCYPSKKINASDVVIYEKYNQYKADNTGHFSDLMKRLGSKPDFSKFSSAGLMVFKD